MKLIAFAGNMGTGKSTAIKLLRSKNDNTDMPLIKFAGPLYELQEQFYAKINPVYSRPESFTKDRKLLQTLGDFGRSINPNIWVDLFKAKVQYLDNPNHPTIILCDDVRFDNEAEAIHELGGKVIKLTSNKSSERIDTSNSNHASEAGISEHLIDAVVPNNGTIEEFRQNLNTVYQILGIFN